MADIVLRDRNGAKITYPGITEIKVNTADGGTQNFVAGDAVEATVDLDFSSGDMSILPESGQLFSQVYIPKPEALKPEIIVKNEVVAGIVGSYEVNEINLDNLSELIPVTEFTVQAGSGGMVPIPMPIGLEAGSIYLVLWNSVGYICKAQAIEYNGLPVVAVGNSVAWGGEDTGEPFAIGEFPEEVAEQNGGLYGGIIPVDGSTSFKAGGYFVGDSGTILEDLAVALDFSNGNQKIMANDGYLVKSAIIEKPATLKPGNIANGVNIAGVDGEFIGDTEEVSVELSFTEDSQVVVPSNETKVISKVTIIKPENLKPEYILKGIDIAGVIGTLEPGGGASGGVRVGKTAVSCKTYVPAPAAFNAQSGTWSAKTWPGAKYNSLYKIYINPNGTDTWTDGTNIYYSANSDHYVIDQATSACSTKTWSGLTSFLGRYIWTDGIDIYYSYDANQYVLDKATSTWIAKTWSGLTSFLAEHIWTDGIDIYYSYNAEQYVLDKATSTWSVKTWSGLTSFSGGSVWTDGTDIYYSSSANQYVLDKATSTWSVKTWSGLTNFSGPDLWTDGENIYYSSYTTQYILNKATSTWSKKTWSGLTSFVGKCVWTDGISLYYVNGSTSYVLTT